MSNKARSINGERTEQVADQAPEDGPKLYREGTHRIVSPEGTLARMKPLAERMGITRLAVLTGLDRIGIPVAAAVRPNSRSIAVHQGKGTTLAAAKASAVMEAAETFHAENVALPLRLATAEDIASMGPALDTARLPRAHGNMGDVTRRLLWLEGRDLATGEPLWVPHEVVTADYTASSQIGSTPVFQATTNGLASGNHWLEAALHGICEVVERDAVALWHAGPTVARQARVLDLASIDGRISAALLPMFAAAAVRIRIWDVTSDIGLPAYLCLAASAPGRDRVQPELGSGCHPDRDVALARALTEAAQARLTVISGARDDLAEQGYLDSLHADRQEAARNLLSGPASRDFHGTPCRAGATLREDLQTALSLLREAGMPQVAWVDLTRPMFGVPVGRAIVPGLEGPWTPPGGEYTPGPRAHRAASRAW